MPNNYDEKTTLSSNGHIPLSCLLPPLYKRRRGVCSLDERNGGESTIHVMSSDDKGHHRTRIVRHGGQKVH
jgi:hypothetical protein